MSGLHGAQGVGEIHIPYNWTYADQSAREGASGFVAEDVGKFARQLDDNSVWMLTATTPAWVSIGGGASGLDPLFSFSAGRNSSTVTNVYLRGPGRVPTNLAGFVLPFNATIVSVTAATDTAESWTAEVRKNDSATVIASLVLSSQAKGKNNSLSVDVDADDEIQIYCNGTDISTPVVTVWFKRR